MCGRAYYSQTGSLRERGREAGREKRGERQREREGGKVERRERERQTMNINVVTVSFEGTPYPRT